MLGIGDSSYAADADQFGEASQVVNGFIDYAGEQGIDTEAVTAALDTESEDFDPAVAKTELAEFASQFSPTDEASYTVTDEETLATEDVTSSGEELTAALGVYEQYNYTEPDPADYGVWVPGIPVLVENGLNAINCVDFVMDRIFRKFGLSGKSFIPILIGTGCGVPGIMASRTIENERDRRMTIMTTTFIPCGAKLPFIAMIAGAIFGGAWWVAPSAYFIGIAAIIISGIMLKKTKPFAGDPAPFVMELPAYHLPTVGNVWSFIKKAGTIILLSTILIWFVTYFGFIDGTFTMLSEDQIDNSILAIIGNGISWLFAPLGWGNWQAAVASITGLVAKENIVGTLGILYGGSGSVYANIAASFTAISGFSFMVFNLLCAPCFAAMGAIKREMHNAKWTAFAIAYQCVFAYAIALVIFQLGSLFTGNGNIIGSIVAFLIVAFILFMLFRPYKKSNILKKKVKV